MTLAGSLKVFATAQLRCYIANIFGKTNLNVLISKLLYP